MDLLLNLLSVTAMDRNCYLNKFVKCVGKNCNFSPLEHWFNPIPTGTGLNQPLYSYHVTQAGRSRVKEYIFIMGIGVIPWSTEHLAALVLCIFTFLSHRFLNLNICCRRAKGQLIPKGRFAVFNSSKKTNQNFSISALAY